MKGEICWLYSLDSYICYIENDTETTTKIKWEKLLEVVIFTRNAKESCSGSNYHPSTAYALEKQSRYFITQNKVQYY